MLKNKVYISEDESKTDKLALEKKIHKMIYKKIEDYSNIDKDNKYSFKYLFDIRKLYLFLKVPLWVHNYYFHIINYLSR